MKRYFPILATVCAALFLASCKTDTPVQSAPSSSFRKLQEKVLTKTCAGCHTQNTDYALQSGLILDPDVAYSNLVGVMSHHPNAKADGILRVKPGNADSSLLYMKVHGLPSGKDYGNTMPMGFNPLTIGQQEFIRLWINAGAPKTGIVAPDSLLDDTTHYPALGFTPLAPPAPGTGYQVTSGKFDIASNFEREIFIYRDLGNLTPIYVNRIQTKMRPNSHHLVLYALDTGVSLLNVSPLGKIRDLRNPDGSYVNETETEMGYDHFLGGSMIQEDDYNFPPGVALQLPAHAIIDLNTHFINYSSSPITGECYANFYTTDAANVPNPAFTLFIPNTNIILPPHQQTVVTQTTTNPYPVKVHFFMLTSHYHARGQKFQIKISGGARNGEVIYESTDWSHPLEKTFATPIVVAQGEGITTVVTYNNTTDKTITYGLKSTDEMDVTYGYYYITY